MGTARLIKNLDKPKKKKGLSLVSVMYYFAKKLDFLNID